MNVALQLTKEIACAALQTHLNTLIRKKNKESNLLICEILEKDIAIIQNAINTAIENSKSK